MTSSRFKGAALWTCLDAIFRSKRFSRIFSDSQNYQLTEAFHPGRRSADSSFFFFTADRGAAPGRVHPEEPRKRRRRVGSGWRLFKRRPRVCLRNLPQQPHLVLIAGLHPPLPSCCRSSTSVKLRQAVQTIWTRALSLRVLQKNRSENRRQASR